MLEQVCNYIHNYFIHDAFPAQYSIESGAVSPMPLMEDGQRFQICGSDLNDGIYTYHAGSITNDDDTELAPLKNEIFSGEIRSMGVPKTVLAITDEIKEWLDKYGEAAKSPYKSENAINYSYSKGKTGWEYVFASRLKPYRKAA